MSATGSRPDPRPDEAAAARRLLAAAQARAASLGLRLGEGATYHIRDRAVAAATGLARPTEDPADAEARATAAFEDLVDAMAAARAEIPGYAEGHPGVIGEDTFWHVLASAFCPRFPIC